MRWLAIPAVLAAAGAARSADVLPPRNQALILLRVLAYDRNLRARTGGELTVAVVFREGDERSEEERDAMAAALEQAAETFVVAGLRPKVKRVPWRGARDLEARLGRLRAGALYAVPSLAGEAPAIGAATRASSALSFAPSRAMVAAGLALGLVNRGSRAGLLVNLAAVRAEGAELEAALLSMVEVTGGRAAGP